MAGTCIVEGTFIAVSESINSFGDLLLVALAIDMVRTLQISNINKWRLRFLFGSGAFAGVIGFIKIGMSFNDNAICKSIPKRHVPLEEFISNLK